MFECSWGFSSQAVCMKAARISHRELIVQYRWDFLSRTVCMSVSGFLVVNNSPECCRDLSSQVVAWVWCGFLIAAVFMFNFFLCYIVFQDQLCKDTQPSTHVANVRNACTHHKHVSYTTFMNIPTCANANHQRKRRTADSNCAINFRCDQQIGFTSKRSSCRPRRGSEWSRVTHFKSCPVTSGRPAGPRWGLGRVHFSARLIVAACNGWFAWGFDYNFTSYHFKTNI